MFKSTFWITTSLIVVLFALGLSIFNFTFAGHQVKSIVNNVRVMVKPTAVPTVAVATISARPTISKLKTGTVTKTVIPTISR